MGIALLICIMFLDCGLTYSNTIKFLDIIANLIIILSLKKGNIVGQICEWIGLALEVISEMQISSYGRKQRVKCLTDINLPHLWMTAS